MSEEVDQALHLANTIGTFLNQNCSEFGVASAAVAMLMARVIVMVPVSDRDALLASLEKMIDMEMFRIDLLMGNKGTMH